MDAKEFRALRGWSQTDLAFALGWSRQKVQRYEAGEDVPLTDEDRVRLHRLRVLNRALITIGLAYATQHVAVIPFTPRDARLDLVLTEREVIDFRTA